MHLCRHRCGLHAQRLRIHPRLDAAAAPGAVDDADRHITIAGAQLARKGISDRREFGDGLRRSGPPLAASEARLGFAGPGFGYLEMADAGVVRARDQLLGALCLRHRPFHVRLTRRQPYVADQYVAHDDDLVFALANRQQVRSACRVCRQLDAPCAISSGHRRGLGTVEPDFDPGTGCRPTPYRQRPVALHHRAVRKQQRQVDLGACRRDRKQQSEQGEMAFQGSSSLWSSRM